MLLITSCEKDQLSAPGVVPEEAEIEQGVSDPLLNEGMIQLGKQLENPYSVENMRLALRELQEEGVLKSGTVSETDIQTTHLYVRFLPADDEEMDIIKSDTTLVFYDHPLDFEIVPGGIYYHDPSLPDTLYTWQYTVVPAGFVLPAVKFEILSELFLMDEVDDDNLKSGGLGAESWERLEDKALEITGNLNSEYDGVTLKASKWRPSGTLTVWDDVLKKQIPLEGVKVRARRWFTTHRGISRRDGSFSCDGQFRRDANYSIEWDRAEWEIQERLLNVSILGVAAWVQVYFNGPKKRGAWNLVIGSATNRDNTMRYAHMHRALMRYCYLNRDGLSSPDVRSFFKGKLRIGYSSQAKTSSAIPYRNIAKQPHVYIYGRTSKGDWESTNNVFAVTIHELAHVAHYKLIGRYSFSELWLPTSSRIIPESWATAVEWRLTNIEYNELGRLDRLNNLAARNYEHNSGYGAGHQNWTTATSEYYTPLFIDLFDDYNQGSRYSTTQPNDVISGYSFRVLEQDVLRRTFGFSSLKERLKLFKPSGLTNTQVDDFVDFYSEF